MLHVQECAVCGFMYAHSASGGRTPDKKGAAGRGFYNDGAAGGNVAL